MFKLTKNRILADQVDPGAGRRRAGAPAGTPPEQPRTPEPAQPSLTRQRAVYEITDLGSLDAAEWSDLRAQMGADREAGATPCPHLVVTSDRRTGLVHHHVPCSSGSEAVRLGEQVIADRPAGETRDAFTVTVTPLLPHPANP